MEINWEYKRPFVRFWENLKPLCEDLVYDVPKAFKEAFYIFPRNLYRFMIKLCQYAPLLYEDRDWDYGYFLDIMRFKLVRMKKTIEDNNIIAEAKKVGHNIQKAIDLLDKIREDEFAKEEHDEHDKKYGPSHMQTIPIPNCTTATACKFLRYNVNTKEDEAKELQDYRKIMAIESRRREQAWHSLWQLIDKELRSWWD